MHDYILPLKFQPVQLLSPIFQHQFLANKLLITKRLFGLSKDLSLIP